MRPCGIDRYPGARIACCCARAASRHTAKSRDELAPSHPSLPSRGGRLAPIVIATSVPISHHGRSTVSISSRANGALGEHLRHESDGIKLEIAPPG